MTLWFVAIVAGAGIGLLLVRSAPPAARLVAWLVALMFVGVSQLASVEFAAVPGRVSIADSGSGDGPSTTRAALAAAARAGPRADELRLRWTAPVADDLLRGWLGAAAEVPERPLPIDPRRVQVRALGEATAGRPVVLAVEVPGVDRAASAELTVRAARDVVVRRQLTLADAGTAQTSFVPGGAGRHTIELVVNLGVHRLTARGDLTVVESPEVLVAEPSGVAAAALRAQGVRVHAVDDVPADAGRYAAIVLGRPAGAPAQQALVTAMLDGAGLFVLAPAFGVPGDPVHAALPVRPAPSPRDPDAEGVGERTARPPEPSPDDRRPPEGDTSAAGNVTGEPVEVDKRAIAIVLVVDRSGSMGTPLPNGTTKMSYAKTSALRTAQALGPGDAAGLVTFGDKGAGRIELPLTDAMDQRAVRAGVARLQHGPERTFLLSGLRMAADVLAASRASVKHVVVLTDGEFEVGESVALRDLAKRMRTDGKITLSIVSILDAHTEQTFKIEAELLTRAGGGQFLPVEDPSIVPVLVSAEVTRALSRVGREPRDGARQDPGGVMPPSGANDAPDAGATTPTTSGRIPVRSVVQSGLLAPEPDARGWPTLGSAIPGTAPLDARVLLVAGNEGWPLLAFGNRGLGRVGAFAADLCGAAGDEFRADPAFPARLAQWVAAVQPSVPQRSGRPLLTAAAWEPVAPDARDAELLRRLVGVEPVVAPGGALPDASSERRVAQAASGASWLLVAALVLLVAVERLLGPFWRGWRLAGNRAAAT